ncbi:MAG: YdeI/OmpD-associated family protein [Gemmatimonadota bacterium]|nr:YdeI/OmpD-associated family protein [Gemmatimonadota bacterium]
MTAAATEPVFFESPATFRQWLATHHETAKDLLVGFHKRSTGKPSMTWAESVDEALSFGWIDGVRRRVDEERYSIRFSPRRKGSVWSAVNIKRVRALIAGGRMRPAGLAAFERRDEKKSAVYSYEQVKRATLTAAQRERFRATPAAWTFFQAQPPSYRQRGTYWVTSAKLDATRDARLTKLIDASAAGRQL